MSHPINLLQIKPALKGRGLEEDLVEADRSLGRIQREIAAVRSLIGAAHDRRTLTQNQMNAIENGVEAEDAAGLLTPVTPVVGNPPIAGAAFEAALLDHPRYAQLLRREGKLDETIGNATRRVAALHTDHEKAMAARAKILADIEEEKRQAEEAWQKEAAAAVAKTWAETGMDKKPRRSVDELVRIIEGGPTTWMDADIAQIRAREARGERKREGSSDFGLARREREGNKQGSGLRGDGQRCLAITKAGKRCRNQANAFGDGTLCTVHLRQRLRQSEAADIRAYRAEHAASGPGMYRDAAGTWVVDDSIHLEDGGSAGDAIVLH